MTTMPEEELHQRLAALEHGPWTNGLSGNNSRRGSDTTFLSSHFESVAERSNRWIANIRNEFNHNSIFPQLCELAIQTGYVPADEGRKLKRGSRTNLLGVSNNQDVFHPQDYFPLPVSADGAGISWRSIVQSSTHNALRFAGFLAHIRSFYEDEQIKSWTKFLNKSVHLNKSVQEEERYRLLKYLLVGRPINASSRTIRLLVGCQVFVTSLANVFFILDDDELGRFGLIHEYWLQRFFEDENVSKSVLLEKNHPGISGKSWAQIVTSSPYLLPAETDREIAEHYRQQFSEQVQLLKRVYHAVKIMRLETDNAYNYVDNINPLPGNST